MGFTINNIDPKKTALIVVDMQNDFIAPGAPLETRMGQEMLPTLKRVLDFSRNEGINVIYTAHVHRKDGSDLGLYGEIFPLIAERKILIDGQEGSEIYPEIAPLENELLIKKSRYNPFFGTDLDTILRNKGIENVVIAGVTTESCCFATARNAMYRGYRVAFLSDATGTNDKRDVGLGMAPAAEVHEAMLKVLGVSTCHVMTSEDFFQKVDTSKNEK